MKKFREDGYTPDELKLYWNSEQLENLCLNRGGSSGIIPSHDPSDDDAVQNLRKYPVSERNHSGEIRYVNDGIERAVFDVPEEAQIILLNFAVNANQIKNSSLDFNSLERTISRRWFFKTCS